MAQIADEAGVGRATVYRHFPTRESLLRGLAVAGTTELADAFAAAKLDELPVDRAIARITSVYLRTGTKYASAISQGGEYCPPDAQQRVIQAVRDVIARGTRDGVLRDDLPGDALFEMLTALVERAMWLTAAGSLTLEEGAETAVTVFLDGVRRA